MTTINLEKKLIKQNRRLLIPKELLLVNEYDKHTGLLTNDALSRVGLNNNIRKGKEIKEAVSIKKEQTAKFNQKRVFHISQIEGICKKYRLRFLPTSYYRGIVDDHLPEKITTFEITYGVKCNRDNTMIVAPAESFELQKKPKDPLMFYKINDDYFYLIHKWGNDLSFKRSLLPLLENSWFCTLTTPMIFLLICFVNRPLGIIVWFAAFTVLILYSAASKFIDGHGLRFLSENEWQSTEI